MRRRRTPPLPAPPQMVIQSWWDEQWGGGPHPYPPHPCHDVYKDQSTPYPPPTHPIGYNKLRVEVTWTMRRMTATHTTPLVISRWELKNIIWYIRKWNGMWCKSILLCFFILGFIITSSELISWRVLCDITTKRYFNCIKQNVHEIIYFINL